MRQNLRDNDEALKASILVAYRVAKAKAAHKVGEKLFLPCAVDIVSEMIGKQEADKIKTVPFSNSV